MTTPDVRGLIERLRGLSLGFTDASYEAADALEALSTGPGEAEPVAWHVFPRTADPKYVTKRKTAEAIVADGGTAIALYYHPPNGDAGRLREALTAAYDFLGEVDFDRPATQDEQTTVMEQIASALSAAPDEGKGEVDATGETAMNDAQIKYMVDRFLSWRLPDNFNPDGGISFRRTFNEQTDHPMKHEPVGTNLFDANQASAMVRHMLTGLPVATSTDPAKIRASVVEDDWLMIETAPKGVKVIAGYFNELGKWRTITARYFEQDTLETSDSIGGDFYAPAGWYEESETHDELLPVSPTHWMPLPAPPRSLAQAETKEAGR